MQIKNTSLIILLVVCLLGGLLGGAISSAFLVPYLENYDWAKNFWSKNVYEKVVEREKILELEEGSATIELVKNVSPSVVSIVVSKELSSYDMTGPDVFNFWGFEFVLPRQDESSGGETVKQQIGGGTGFVIATDGIILTNKHVVEDESADYSVVFNDGTAYEAEILGRDLVNDIAVLKIEAQDLPVIEVGDSSALQVGQTVVAIGNALTEYENTVTRGVVSGLNRKIEAYDENGRLLSLDGIIQTDAAINPGNSGGPLLNLSGEVIGINTAMNVQGRAIGFAIPINQAKNVIQSVREHGRIVRPWLGVRYIQINPRLAELNDLPYDYGALIVGGGPENPIAVVPGSPADEAGLTENDIILEINGRKLTEDHSIVHEIAEYLPGDEIEMKVFQKGEEKIINLTLAERE